MAGGAERAGTTGNGKIVRYAVIACQRTGAVRALGESLAEFFGVERRTLTLNWITRRHLKAERAWAPNEPLQNAGPASWFAGPRSLSLNAAHEGRKRQPPAFDG
jgi:hypothetical protein